MMPVRIGGSSISSAPTQLLIRGSLDTLRDEREHQWCLEPRRGARHGEIIALLDHDDLLHPHALAEIAICYADHPEAEIVYSDDDKIDLATRRFAPQFKPDWSPTLLLSFMYLSHLFTFKRSLFERVGGFRVGFEGSQDFDLALRLSEHARAIRHIPRVLYHWRAVPGSTATSGDAKPDAFDRGRRAVQEAFDRRGSRRRSSTRTSLRRHVSASSNLLFRMMGRTSPSSFRIKINSNSFAPVWKV